MPIDLGNGRQLASDAGWGCMIRCGQMALYTTIARTCDKNSFKPAELIQKFFSETSPQLGPFSLQRLVMTARDNLGKAPGEWFRATTFSLALENCINSSPIQTEFSLVNVLDNSLYWEEIYSRALLYHAPPLSIENCISQLCETSWEKKVLLVIHTMLGVDNIDPRYEPFLQTMCRLESFIGFLGGEQNKAYYFYGMDSREYLYIDPHFCRNAEISVTKEDVNRTFFGSKPYFKLSRESLNSSVSIWILLENSNHFSEFYHKYVKLSRNMNDDFFFCDALRRSEEDLEDIIEF